MTTMVQTVRGPVAADDLGPALLHEHVFIASPEGIANHNHTWGGPWWDEEHCTGSPGSIARST